MRREFERQTGVALIDQTWRLWFDAQSVQSDPGWWDGVREGAITESVSDHLKLTPVPVSSIVSVTSYARDNTSSLYAASNYELDKVSRPARLILNEGAIWPTALRRRNALSVEIVCGYGASASEVPPDIIHAIKIAAAYRYEYRGDGLSQNAVNAGDKLLKPVIDRYKQNRL